MADSGFVAGTLIHTDKGLVPIEQLEIGDMVLSRDEHNPDGELAYKKVLNTFVSPQKQRIVRVAYWTVKDEVTDARVKEVENSEQFYSEDEQTDVFYIYCTENHAFWTKEEEWLSAVDLATDDKEYRDKDYSLVTHNDRPIFQTSYSTFSTPLIRTSIEDIAIQRDHLSNEPGDIYNFIDFIDGRPVILKNVNVYKSAQYNWWDETQDHIDLKENPNHRFAKEIQTDDDFRIVQNAYLHERGLLDKDGWTDAYENLTDEERDYHFIKSDEEQYYLATVYNIEVEDHHTYFVGEHGVWVYDSTAKVSKQ